MSTSENSKNGKNVSVAELTETIGTSEVARRKGVDRSSVIRWVQKGHLRAIQMPFGGSYRFDPKEVDAFTPPTPGNPAWKKDSRLRTA